MIHPGMSPTGERPPSGWGLPHATMLAFLTTDAAVTPRFLQEVLEEAVAQSFNRIVVDGDMSTNDTVLFLANGLAGNPTLGEKSGQEREIQRFREAVRSVCLTLARMIVADGEGVHRKVTIRVEGARNDQEADLAARAVARSPLVKTSWHGGDPNWGRILDALGYSGATVDESRVDIGYRSAASRSTVWAVRGGRPTTVSFKRLCQIVEPEEFELRIRLHLGPGQAVLYATDLTEAYVTFNKGDLSDPASLGG